MVDQYRKRLLEVDPEYCRELDEQMVYVGQGWVCDTTVADPDELVTTQDIENRYGVNKNAMRAFIRRNSVVPRGRKGKSYLYRLGDILSARINV
jgi:hypothetical protein